jgi:alkylation response protein AidB-like acyl-CoA dehydrogenase
MSEPSAGSDLASVMTTAQQHQDGWVLSGQKVWTTGAHVSEFAICLARTDWDLPKHRGLTMFVVDLKAPEVTIRPLRQMTGDAEFNEVFLDSVAVTGSDVIGDVNGGWQVVKTWLTYEHSGVSAGDDSAREDGAASIASPIDEALPHDLVRLARSLGKCDDAAVRQKIVSTFIRDVLLRVLERRLPSAMRSGQLPEQAGSILKLLGARGDQLRAETAVELCGAGGTAWRADADTVVIVNRFLSSQSRSIVAGTNEIHRNILGEHVLQLPREATFDRDRPFREIPKNALSTGRAPGARES